MADKSILESIYAVLELIPKKVSVAAYDTSKCFTLIVHSTTVLL